MRSLGFGAIRTCIRDAIERGLDLDGDSIADVLAGGSMIKKLEGLPVGVIGFEVAGKLQAEDYRDVLLPAIEDAAREGDVRFVIVIPEFNGMTPGALWQDLKVGIEHFRAWKRIALVTDIEWMHHMTSIFGWMTPGEVKTFPAEDRDTAIAWAAG